MATSEQPGGVECPTCGRTDFVSERGMKAHHKRTHGESLPEGLQVSCVECGDTIRRYPYEVEQRGHHFCGDDCRAKYLSNGYKETECAWCGESLNRPEKRVEESDNQFCNYSCQGEWMSENWIGEDNHNYEKVRTECHWCGEKLNRKPSRVCKFKNQFCSLDCWGEFVSSTNIGPKHPNYKDGESSYGPGWNRKKKRRIRIRDQARCQECGRTEPEHIDEFGIKHDVHHIIPAREFDDAEKRNHIDNLVTLCHGKCHAKWNKIPGLRPQ